MHIGSSSKMPSTSADAPAAVGSTLTFGNAMAVDDRLVVLGLARALPELKLAYSEGQIGWIPYILERADKVWEENRAWGGFGDKVPKPPSTYYYRQIYGCFFDDVYGLENLEKVGRQQHLLRDRLPALGLDLAHAREVAQKLMGHLPATSCTSSCRGNAIKLLGLDLER